MERSAVQKVICDLTGQIDSLLWYPIPSIPSDLPLRIDTILLQNRAFERYVFFHREEISDFQLMSVESMIRCTQNELGGISFSCPDCHNTSFVPFRCHSRVCPLCGKQYANAWGKELMRRFYPRVIGM